QSVVLGLLPPAPQRRLSQPQPPRNRADPLAALAYQPYRLGLVLIRKRSPLAAAALLHHPLLAHFRASRCVHVTGANPYRLPQQVGKRQLGVLVPARIEVFGG